MVGCWGDEMGWEDTGQNLHSQRAMLRCPKRIRWFREGIQGNGFRNSSFVKIGYRVRPPLRTRANEGTDSNGKEINQLMSRNDPQ